MPYTTRKLRGGRVRVTNKQTGKVRIFKSRGAFSRWRRVAEHVKSRKR